MTTTADDGKADSASPKPARARRPARGRRTRRAHWRGELRGIRYFFTYEPGGNLIRVRRAHARKSKTITIAELLHVLEGQRLLPLGI